MFFYPCLCCFSLGPMVLLYFLNLKIGQSFSFKSTTQAAFDQYLLRLSTHLTKFHVNKLWNSWVNATKFLTGASAVGSIAIPVILKHSGVIGWGALAMELSSFFVLVLAIMCYIGMSDDDDYSILWDVADFGAQVITVQKCQC